MLAQIADPVTLETLVRLIPAGGVTGVMIALVWMILTGRLILPREMSRLTAERDEWREIAYRSLKNNEGLKDTTREAVDTLRIVAKAGSERSTGAQP